MDESARQALSADLARLADGDRNAFDPVFVRAWPVLRDFCSRALCDPLRGEDAAQQALLRVFEQASDYRAGADALTWMLSIASFEARSARRREHRRREDEPEEVADAGMATDDTVASWELRAAVVEVVAGLPPADAEALWSSVGAGERPAISGPTYRKRLQRALVRLRQAWRDRHGAS